MNKIKPEEAKRMLSGVKPEKAFWINNGPIAKSLGEFAAALKKLSPVQLAHHVSKEKNDFAKWIDEVVGDKILAQRVRVLKTKEEITNAISQRIDALRKIAK